jgi:hypothetical protein
MQSDWAEYHDSSWPGIESVIEVSSPFLTPEDEPADTGFDLFVSQDSMGM